MAVRGRKPKPTQVKKRAGNPGKRPLNDREPAPRKAAPKCPTCVAADPVAAAHWEWLCGELGAMDILTTADRLVMELISIEYALKLLAESKLTRGRHVVKTKAGNLIQNPWLNVANGCKKRLQVLMAEVGLTPSARTRINVGGEGKGTSLSDFARSR